MNSDNEVLARQCHVRPAPAFMGPGLRRDDSEIRSKTLSERHRVATILSGAEVTGAASSINGAAKL